MSKALRILKGTLLFKVTEVRILCDVKGFQAISKSSGWKQLQELSSPTCSTWALTLRLTNTTLTVLHAKEFSLHHSMLYSSLILVAKGRVNSVQHFSQVYCAPSPTH